jgi:hypothetical protein
MVRAAGGPQTPSLRGGDRAAYFGHRYTHPSALSRGWVLASPPLAQKICASWYLGTRKTAAALHGSEARPYFPRRVGSTISQPMAAACCNARGSAST